MGFYETFDDTFWLTLSGILVGVIGLGIRSCYKSKCAVIEMGCIKVTRNIDDEKEIDEMEMQYRGNNNADDI